MFLLSLGSSSKYDLKFKSQSFRSSRLLFLKTIFRNFASGNISFFDTSGFFHTFLNFLNSSTVKLERSFFSVSSCFAYLSRVFSCGLRLLIFEACVMKKFLNCLAFVSHAPLKCPNFCTACGAILLSWRIFLLILCIRQVRRRHSCSF